MDIVLLNQAFQDWENFISNLNDDGKKILLEFTEQSASVSLHNLAAIKDIARFDQTINRLSNRYLYDEEIIATVYNFYIERELHELAFDYLSKSKEYFEKNRNPIPAEIQLLIDNSETTHLLRKLKLSLEKILTLKPKNISLISPEIINDKRELDEFILHEIILASNVLLDKIHAVKQISHEDRFNDLLLAILRLRFPIWGWTIQDQPRMGSSPTGKSAGEVDILVQAAGQNVAFIEALILKSTNYSLTKSHILKCFNYISYLKRYYIIIYFRGPVAKFDSTWEAYKTNVLKTPFPSPVAIDNTLGFEDLLPKFEDLRNLKIAKTFHQTEVKVFHVMINLGVTTSPPKKAQAKIKSALKKGVSQKKSVSPKKTASTKKSTPTKKSSSPKRN